MLHALTRYKVSGPTDPYWSSVVALLHFEGPDHSTTFTDETGHLWELATSSPAEISTTKSKFGGSSLHDNVSATYGGIRAVDPHSQFNFGTGDFTVEWWNNLDDNAVYQTFFAMGYVSSGDMLLQTTSTSSIAVYVSGTSVMSSSTTIPTGVWTHYAIVKDSGVLRLYINGVQACSVSDSTSLTDFDYPAIGGRGNTGTYPTHGYIDEFRATKGVCRYPSGTTFAVPTAAFPNH